MPLVKLCTSRAGIICCASVRNISVGVPSTANWSRRGSALGRSDTKPGYRWYGKARVWQEETLDTYVSLVWDTGCEEPWLL